MDKPTCLLLDVGNSRLKWCLQQGSELGPMQLLQHTESAIDGLLAALHPLPAEAWLASVVDARAQRLGEVLQARGIRTRTATSLATLDGLVSGYRDPSQLGVDRFLALLAARRHSPARDCLVIDAGTALTIDALAADGRHQGGCILPGLALMRAALSGGTDRLGAALAAAPTDVDPAAAGLADHTARAIEQGILHAALGAIERVRRGREESPVLLCGGDAERLAATLEQPWSLHPKLVLEGLARYADCVRGAPAATA